MSCAASQFAFSAQSEGCNDDGLKRVKSLSNRDTHLDLQRERPARRILVLGNGYVVRRAWFAFPNHAAATTLALNHAGQGVARAASVDSQSRILKVVHPKLRSEAGRIQVVLNFPPHRFRICLHKVTVVGCRVPFTSSQRVVAFSLVGQGICWSRTLTGPVLWRHGTVGRLLLDV